MKYEPGQKLTTPKEIMTALIHGEILFQGFKPFHMRDDGEFYFVGENDPISVNLSSKYLDDTFIWNPNPTRTDQILEMIEKIERTVFDEADCKRIQQTLWAANQLRETVAATNSFTELWDAAKLFDDAVAGKTVTTEY